MGKKSNRDPKSSETRQRVAAWVVGGIFFLFLGVAYTVALPVFAVLNPDIALNKIDHKESGFYIASISIPFFLMGNLISWDVLFKLVQLFGRSLTTLGNALNQDDDKPENLGEQK